MILRKGLGSLVHKFLLVVGLMAAAENDVAVVISLGGDNCGMAELGYGEEGVAVAGSLDRVKRNLYGAVSAVLESDRAAQSEASSRWICDSVVLAPMAPQLMRSEIY